MRGQCVLNKTLAFKTTSIPQGKGVSNNRSDTNLQDIINIQVLYDINQTIEQNTWDSNF